MTERAPTRVGVLGSSRQALVDDRGTITPDGGRWQLDWWVGADDRWHIPAREAAVRQTLVGGAPVVETSLRVPGGDAVQRAYGVGGPAGLVAVEIENASGAPFVAALVLGPAAAGRMRAVGTRGSWVTVDGRPALRTPRPAMRWAAGMGGDTLDVVTAGRAQESTFNGVGGRGMRLEVALLHPVAHRTRLRCALAVGRPGRSVPVDAVDLSLLPDAAVAAAGWDAQRRRGIRVVLPDARLQEAVDAGRAALLLASDAAQPPERRGGRRARGLGIRRRGGRGLAKTRYSRPGAGITSCARPDAVVEHPDATGLGFGHVHVARRARAVARGGARPPRGRGGECERGGLRRVARRAPRRVARPELGGARGADTHRTRLVRRPLARRPAGTAVGVRAADAAQPPGLDRAWSTTAPRGETLLAAPTGAPGDAGSFS